MKTYKKKLEDFYERVYSKATKVIPWGKVETYCDCCGTYIKYGYRIEVGEYPNCKVYYVGRICFGNLEDLRLKNYPLNRKVEGEKLELTCFYSKRV